MEAHSDEKKYMCVMFLFIHCHVPKPIYFFHIFKDDFLFTKVSFPLFSLRVLEALHI